MDPLKLILQSSTHKILFVFPSLQEEGPLRMAINIALELKSDFDFTFLGLKQPKHRDAYNKIMSYGFNASCAHFTMADIILRPSILANELIAEHKPDLVHSHLLAADLICSKMHNNGSFPVITTVHNNALQDYRASHGLVGWVAGLAHLRSLNRFNNLVACSNSVQAYLASRGLESSVIKVGVDLEQLRRDGCADDDNLRIKYDIPGDHFVFVSVSNLVNRKNVEFAIKAFLKASHNRATTMMIIGTGPELKGLRKKYESEKIKFTGRVKCVGDYLRLGDVYVSASKSEGLPAGVIEAFAAGIACLLSDIPSHRELLIDYDKCIFNLRSTEQLEALMAKVLDGQIDLTEVAILQGYLVRELTSEKMGKNYGQTYIDSLGETRNEN